jgi:hypothetical protein
VIEEHRTVYRISLAIVAAMAVIAMPLDHTVTLGLILGAALYYVYLLVLTRTVTAQLEAARAGTSANPFAFFVRMAALALPLLIAAKFPEHFSILAAFAPLFINHIVTFVVYGRKEAAAS